MQILMGCNSNTHHVIWSSTGINKLDEFLLAYLMADRLDIVDMGN